MHSAVCLERAGVLASGGVGGGLGVEEGALCPLKLVDHLGTAERFAEAAVAEARIAHAGAVATGQGIAKGGRRVGRTGKEQGEKRSAGGRPGETAAGQRHCREGRMKVVVAAHGEHRLARLQRSPFARAWEGCLSIRSNDA